MIAKEGCEVFESTLDYGIIDRAGTSGIIKCLSDAYFACEPDLRSRSITGSCIMVGESPVSWKSKVANVGIVVDYEC
ncbi:hypothetical protein JCM33374_g4936 [Metschnikowia sp. JCM 33374]|nr:hypothetical protein JCM33374_g4936 [Metschnikowia sp. JCM 33374]